MRPTLLTTVLLILVELTLFCCNSVAGSDAPKPPDDYLSERYTADGTGLNAGALATLIRDRIFAREFADAQASLKIDAGALVVTQTREAHAQLRDFLALLRKPLAAGAMAVSETDAWRAAIESSLLEKRVSVSFAQTPLNEAVAQLSTSTGIAITVDRGITAEKMRKVDLKLDTVSLASALKWITCSTQTNYCLHDHGILITDGSREDLELRIYAIADLLQAPDFITRLFDTDKNDLFQPVPMYLPYLSAPEWGQVVQFLGDRMIVRGDRFEQKLVNGYISGLRLFLKQIRDVEPDGKPPKKPLDPARVPGHSLPEVEEPWKKELRAKLEKHVSFDFKDKPFKDAIAFIRSECGVNLVLDPKVLANAVDSPITLRVSDMRAELALEWILKLNYVEYDFVDEVVYLHPHLNINYSAEVRYFYVRDLASVIAASELKSLVTDAILDGSFELALGTAIDEKNGILIIMQRPYELSRLEILFDQFRLHANDPDFYPTHMAFKGRELYPDNDCAIFNLSDMCEVQAAALVEKFQVNFPAADGADGRRFIRLAGKRLIVQGTRAMRDEIARALEEIRKARVDKR